MNTKIIPFEGGLDVITIITVIIIVFIILISDDGLTASRPPSFKIISALSSYV